MAHIYLESFGVKLDVEIRALELMDEVRSILPPGWKQSTEFPEDGHFTVQEVDGAFEVLAEGVLVASDLSAELAVHVLDAQIRARVAFVAPDYIFVHAGAVAIAGRGILVPGRSFAGKSSLVAALVERGAAYLSDEFAVLDAEGMVHPYPRPLSLREGHDRYGTNTTAEELGGLEAGEAMRPTHIVVTQFVPGTSWSPQRKSSAAGALHLLTNTVPARSRQRAATVAVARAARGCVVLEGPRGEAGAAADAILAGL